MFIPKHNPLHETYEMEDETNKTVSNGSLDLDSSKNLVVASKKRPPPESMESLRIRSYVIVSFWAVVILLGLPIWWWTTSIHRARLPLQNMLEWADGKVWRSQWNGFDGVLIITYLLLGLQACISSPNHY